MKAELLWKAACCYEKAGLAFVDDACRCFELAGDMKSAALLHEKVGSHTEAARCYDQAHSSTDAARCYLFSGQPVEAARCLLQAGDLAGSSWILADKAQRFVAAEAAIRAARPRTPAELLAMELVLARCNAATGATEEATKRLRSAMKRLRALPLEADRSRLEGWALTVAAAVRRPDLSALIHAGAVAFETPGARERWTAWALEELGDATGVPAAEDGALGPEPSRRAANVRDASGPRSAGRHGR